MKNEVTLSAQDSFKTIAEAALMVTLPEVYKENLRVQIVAFAKWVESVSGLEKKCEQLELDLNEQQLQNPS